MSYLFDSNRSLAYESFYRRIWSYAFIVKGIRRAITAWLEYERTTDLEGQPGHECVDNQPQDCLARFRHPQYQLIDKAVSHLRQHDVHDSMFESFYLKHTGTYYQTESAQLRATSSPRDFMLQYVQRIRHERLRAAPVMDNGSVTRVENEMKVAFLINNCNLEWIAKGQDGGAC